MIRHNMFNKNVAFRIPVVNNVILGVPVSVVSHCIFAVWFVIIEYARTMCRSVGYGINKFNDVVNIIMRFFKAERWTVAVCREHQRVKAILQIVAAGLAKYNHQALRFFELPVDHFVSPFPKLLDSDITLRHKRGRERRLALAQSCGRTLFNHHAVVYHCCCLHNLIFFEVNNTTKVQIISMATKIYSLKRHCAERDGVG
jgi:hypothetical protein